MCFKDLKQNVISLVNNVFNCGHNYKEENRLLIEAESLILDYLKKHPEDIDAYILLALAVNLTPLADSLQAIKALKKVLELDAGHYKALLILASIEHILYGIIPDETGRRLKEFSHADPTVQSMVEIAKAVNYQMKDGTDKYINALKKSIELCQDYAWNYIYLGECYREQGHEDIALDYELKGINNVLEYPYIAETALDPDRYINEYITGVYMSRANKELNTPRTIFHEEDEEYEDA